MIDRYIIRIYLILRSCLVIGQALDSNDVIDLETITEASRIINKILDKEESIFDNIDELDIYSKEKGE